MQNIIQYSIDHPVAFSAIVIVLVAWSLLWKGMALWKSAHNNDLAWFLVLLVVNTLGILEILYLFVFKKERAPHQEKNAQS